MMEFRIADSFTDSLAQLTNAEQKAVKTAAFDLQLNPQSPALQFHKIEKAKDKRFWSIHVNQDIRLIVHKTGKSLLLCYTDHHDAAYRWAERRKLEIHPQTGAAQMVEIRETVREFKSHPSFHDTHAPGAPDMLPSQSMPSHPLQAKTASSFQQKSLFRDIPENDLLKYGVPVEWLADVQAADEETILELAEHLPAEAGEALIDLATGVTPKPPEPVKAGRDPFDHPDARRRFRTMESYEELARALEFPWEKWTVFLHPDQHQLVEKSYNGPARISGSAGTGKTIVALHRAVYLAKEHPDARVLLVTFSNPLAALLHTKLRRLIHHEPHLGERLEVDAMNAFGKRLFTANFGPCRIASQKILTTLLDKACRQIKNEMADANSFRFPDHFLMSEWSEVVDAWQLEKWEMYRDVKRLGRKRRLPEKQRRVLWAIFERFNSILKEENQMTWPALFGRLTAHYADSDRTPYDYIIVDEAQDISIPQLRFLAVFGKARPDALFFCGDLGQRIFQPLFSWKSLGVDIRGRSHTLRINYRTSHQIRKRADRLLDPELSDVDGNVESRNSTISVFNGPTPLIDELETEEEEKETVSAWLDRMIERAIAPHEIGIFVRSPHELGRAAGAVLKSGLPFNILDETIDTKTGAVSISTMHLAKGLEFRAVAVMAVDDEVIPLQSRIEDVADGSDLEEVYNSERHLLYVACTRAREELMITGIYPASEFIDDML